MDELVVVDVDCSTGETTERPMSPEEISDLASVQSEATAEEAVRQQKLAAAAAVLAANPGLETVLSAFGLTLPSS